MTKRVVTFGRQPTEKPKHNFAEVHFPELATLDKGTSEGMVSRVLTSEGGNARSVPRTIYFQKVQTGGHDGSVAVGALHEITIDGETGIMSGKGWLLDSEDGRDAALHIAGQALFHNSVDLAETKVEIIEHGDFWDDDFWVEVLFVEWKVGATTLVGKPAFADAHAVMAEELTASLEAGPLIVQCDHVVRIQTADDDTEVLASAGGLPSWDDFHVPEPEQHRPITVTAPREDGWIPVTGHLSLWESCHDGIEGRCTRTPRPRDNYASFNKPSVLTDKGQVEAGPIALYGGHIPLHKAADDPANAWADVRVIAGKHGPWLSGVVRPGVALDDVKTYVARASQISGHWKGDRLKMIVACNAPGFDVPGSGFSFSTNADGEVLELVASYPACSKPEPDPGFDIIPEINFGSIAASSTTTTPRFVSTADVIAAGTVPSYLKTMDPLTPAQQAHLLTWVQTRAAGTATEDEPVTEEFDAEVERMRRERELDLLEHGSSLP